MFIVQNYFLAVVLCFVTMLCWGSWGNTQKLAAKTWRYELFYWDYVLGIVLLSIFLAFTFGSIGEQGRSFTTDIVQVSSSNFWSAFFGGVIFNASNILLAAAISISGMAVAFPLGVGLALVLGVLVNYIQAPKGDPILLFLGVFAIMIAIVFNGVASGKMNAEKDQTTAKKGIWIAVSAGILMSLFYRFVAAAMDLNNFESPEVGKATPYSAFFIFAIGMLASNFIFNTLVMKKPFVGQPVSYKDYFTGGLSTHMVGVLGGLIWGVGTSLSYIAAGKAGAAISYGLGQGATMVAALWGVFIWKEFKGANKNVNFLLFLMFLLFTSGLILIITSGGN
ncbi:MAG TPA: multidrug DMT transporter permease [Marinilabiliales bacterium]|jgi:glucose uptake protein|nr:MAG: multidrug DMT transporter permease [Bacteroidetes bacterium GWA2_40_14]OFX57953.1 MAG: multidrug DMT transporter permease [Bacteroidetes bacterium GWC2_40_13]OFX73388.1 MAG: multidrug DMT transporter permease [Bacteroidetes bacterium GWD2_40_43]OFX94738.1 MAG: multidrug DMT transporter permease [Bacteroidetes bacterium GWE2_40_63]OFY24732.1 MAG: multidrug DMT transporter permease [Bacteroidetes bacterium GWF2_40_13]OFZ24030.1 MAG: multidrug DMT transporter permease [Bacteroidetes bacte